MDIISKKIDLMALFFSNILIILMITFPKLIIIFFIIHMNLFIFYVIYSIVTFNKKRRS